MKNTNITIYSRSAHIIEYFPEQTKSIILPKFVDITSILILDSEGTIVPFSYISEINTNNVIGSNVQVIKKEKTIKGKVLSMTQDNITILSNNKIITLRNYDQIIVSTSDELNQPQLIIPPEYYLKELTLSYLINNITWECVGTALIDDNNLYLRLAGNINNNTESDIDADTTLVSGEVYQKQKNHYPESRMILSAAPIKSDKVQTSMSEDFIKYKIGKRIIRNKDIAELGTFTYPITKLYIHKTEENNIVRFGYRFIAKEYIPACSINVFSIDRGIDSFLGSNNIGESQRNDEIDIIIGESTLLQCKSLIVISDDITIDNEEKAKQYKLSIDKSQWHVITEDITVEITNHIDKKSFLIIKHNIGNKLLLDTKCKTYEKRNNGYLEWYFELLPTTDKQNFTCQIITASY